MRRSGGSVAARIGRLACVAGLTFGLSACFRPLYGPTASGESIQALLASVQVDEVAMAQGQERLGHYLRSELIFDLDGSGQPAAKRYRLKLSGSEVVQTPIVSSTTGRAEAGTIVANIRYSLEDMAGLKVISEGVATSTATYDRSIQRFASQRAARDAEIRLANVLADQIKTRVASVLSTKP
ncbi:LPS assembly lipoprotein LptE [Methylobacterium sp. NEAU 140]|uniref:LPS assembly lipoprotein LptE n=1 Tax=Methylobacterium sp. NEAU 140 TaxID=3064945 RepID=UPI002736551B|nr:LPS assembly lipoprotein LptE [Methylobacterium sp. NEAU 140]MDP4025476.1 LPS assembly lipoprotein LptE [Methylobacterium sp. NEAU 140]